MREYFLRITHFLKAKINLIALGICGAFSGFWMILLAKRYYYAIATGGWDNALLTQFVRNLAHGTFYSTLNGSNFIADHCYFISFLLAPFYWLWPDPMFIRYFQIWVFFLGAYVFFLILKKRFHPFIALGGMLAFILHPANIAMIRGCFNFEPFAIPLVFLIFKTFEEKKYPEFLTCCFLLMMVKEQMPLVVMMFGILAFFIKQRERVKWALVPLLLGVGVFILEVFILVPYIRQDLPVSQSSYWTRYAMFGKTPHDILFFLLTHPVKIYEQVVSTDIIKWYNDLFGMWGGLAFLSPQILFPAIPLFLKSILGNFKLEHNVTGVYYASTFTPYIFLAVWSTLDYIKNKWRTVAHVFVLALMFIHAFNYFPSLVFPLFKTPVSNKAITIKRFLDKMPDHATIVGPFDYVRNWKDLYWWHSYLDGRYQSGRKFELPDHLEFLVADLGEKKREHQIYKLMMKTPDFYERWRLNESIEDLALYVKNKSPQEPQMKLVEATQESLLSRTVFNPTVFEKTIALEDIEFPEVFPKENRILPVTAYWKSLKKTKDVYRTSFKVMLGKEKIYQKSCMIGSTIYQTKRWEKGEYIMEHYFYLLPRLKPGHYVIEYSVTNDTTSKWFYKQIIKKSLIVE